MDMIIEPLKSEIKRQVAEQPTLRSAKMFKGKNQRDLLIDAIKDVKIN